MLSLIISSIILTSAPGAPTEIIGSAATPTGGKNEIIVEQPQSANDPFGLPASAEQPSNNFDEQPDTTLQLNTSPSSVLPQSTTSNNPIPFVSQSSEVNPTDMNPLDYKNQIENTIYQSGDRLIDVQSIPLQDISSAIQPNLQPELTDYPAF